MFGQVISVSAEGQSQRSTSSHGRLTCPKIMACERSRSRGMPVVWIREGLDTITGADPRPDAAV